jgi:hypothetical protein
MKYLASYPRSGNKMFLHALHYGLGMKCRTVYHVPDMPSEIAPRWDRVEVIDFLKTHELPVGKTPAIYLVRDPRDVFCSYALWTQKTTKWTDETTRIAEGFIEGRGYRDSGAYGGWSEHVRQWRSVATVVLRYEDCFMDPIGALQKVLGIQERVGDTPSFQSLQANCGWYFQHGHPGRWNDMPDWLVRKTEDLHGTMMRELGYETR